MKLPISTDYRHAPPRMARRRTKPEPPELGARVQLGHFMVDRSVEAHPLLVANGWTERFTLRCCGDVVPLAVHRTWEMLLHVTGVWPDPDLWHEATRRKGEPVACKPRPAAVAVRPPAEPDPDDPRFNGQLGLF